ncbi:hypothetical protein IMG5_092590 [Ichthyophthirius multifiliis]|uniref:NadR/Ttd14 AAA domain-containing protein n=1 Tax=Ichthyophthirius multifiliis TaxID=5932 RepID=G0QRF7_ICHMU|nr:hypothetical protein IMG5_092590 [Ichthyophthirius multifiliis]EGR32192.1 hypothetical protein IMG5_092590 [Ichthyophthirius multifiliis]|eukprot:XP_004035678.1 hypothetical protein IMG5_092590 [Ichthyophthirius multifiliis]
MISLTNIKIDNDESNIQIEQKEEHKIFKICITGGPCAGKTSCLVLVSEKLRDEGFNVFTVPETSTIIANGGGMIQMQTYDDQQSINFQKALMRSQVQLEDTFYGIAKLSKQKAIILCDRGLMDGSAYLPLNLWNNMLKQMNIDEVQVRDRRYDCVIHLITAADGAVQYYNKNNNARHESPQEAICVDRKLQIAWLGHPYFKLVDNYSVKNFEEKLNKVVTIIRQAVGLPAQLKELHKKFLLDTEFLTPQFPEDLKVLKFFIEDNFIQHSLYLEGPEHKIYTKVRRRGWLSQYIYIWSQSEFKNGVIVGKNKRQLNFKEYLFYLQLTDKNRKPLLKQRFCFIWEGLSYVIDTYINIQEGFSTLKVKMQDENQMCLIPDFLNIKREVTDEKGYKSRFLSKKNWYIPSGDEDVINFRKESL